MYLSACHEFTQFQNPPLHFGLYVKVFYMLLLSFYLQFKAHYLWDPAFLIRAYLAH